jgi:UDP-glucose 4-epimerase
VKAVVTGCAGFIGSHLTESLLADGVEVVGVDCFNDNYARQQKLANLAQAREWVHFDFVPVDLTRGRVDDLVADADVVFHLAAEPGVRPSWGDRFDTYVRNNLLATQLLLESVRSAPERRFVYASSSSVYGEADIFPTSESAAVRPHSPYGVTKLSAEHLCFAYRSNLGLDVVALRYFSVYGPRQRPDMAFHRFCRAALEGRPLLVFGDGEQSRDFTHVDDVVRATRAAATARRFDERVFNIGGGSRVTLNQTLKILTEIAGKTLEVVHGGREQGDVRDTGADIGRARRVLGFDPAVKLEQGLAAEFEWMRTQERRPFLDASVAS